MRINKASTCFAALLCVAFLSSGCGGGQKPEEPEPETLKIPLSQTVSIEMVKLSNQNQIDSPSDDVWFGKYEVTQSQWEAIMGNNPSTFKAPNNPVERVSWDDCQEFLEKLNALPTVKESGLTFRLPTEKEWEHACRAGATGDYCKLADGTEVTEKTLKQVAWFDLNAKGKTHPVGLKKPNAFGLYDMHGNVWEWTLTLDDSIPVAPGVRVYRGGSWFHSANNCESSYHNGTEPFVGNFFLGFRLCASPSAANNPVIAELCAGMVQIPGEDYKMGKFEVTQAQWEEVMHENPSKFKNPDNPVENVSWDDCHAFLKKLNALPAVKQSGLMFRLPTDEEWEYACRAGATGDYCLRADGTEITSDTLDEVAWFDGERTHPVGQKKPNAFGLYDMHGNVKEWTATSDGECRVNRGGGGGSLARACRSSARDGDKPSYRSHRLGLRLCAETVAK